MRLQEIPTILTFFYCKPAGTNITESTVHNGLIARVTTIIVDGVITR